MKITIDHVVLEVGDVQASAGFYESLLGFPSVRLAEFLAGTAPFASVRVNRESIIDLFPRKMWKSKRRAANPNHVCFTMDQKQLQALKRRLSRRKLPILRQSNKNFGAQGIARSIYFEDPDGVTLEARVYPAA